MTNKKTLTIFVGLISLFSFSAFVAKDDPFLDLLKKLDDMTKKHPIEKVYLHLDKPYYAVGDNIWFKAYVIDGKSRPSDVSRILYVELIDGRDSVLKLLKLPLEHGLTNGDFQLEDELSEGNYRIRAYTQWMRNAGPDYFFDKTLRIGNYWANKVFASAQYSGTEETTQATLKFTDNKGNPLKGAAVNYELKHSDKTRSGKGSTDANGAFNFAFPAVSKGKILATIVMPNGEKITKTIPIKVKTANIDVQFLPEGGSLIEGLPCKIAIKAMNSTGRGEDVKGTIIDNNGTNVLDFETAYLGMGFFVLNPDPGKTYTAKLKRGSEFYQSIPLPTPQKSGHQITVNNIDTSKISVKVLLSADLLNKGELNLLAMHNGAVLLTTKVATNRQMTLITIPKTQLPSGIIQLTLFSDNQPVSERIVFVNNPNNRIEVSFENLKDNYIKRGNVDFNITSSKNGKPIQGSFSVAITNTGVVAPDPENESNILTGLLLRSDLAGYIEKPNHYFLKDDEATRLQLDNLMLTQGWRKIDWNTLNEALNAAPTFKAERGMSISGTVIGKGKKPIANGKIVLMSASKVRIAATTETDENGRFSFDDSVFGDSIRFALQASTKDDKKEVSVKLDKVPQQQVTSNYNSGDLEVNVNASMSSYLKESNDYFEDQQRKGFLNRTNQLKTVQITQKAKRTDSASANSSNLNGRGMADAIITSNDLKYATDLAQYLRSGRVAGVAVDENDNPINTRNGANMSISFDGLVTKNFPLSSFNIEDIESIEVLKGIAYTTIYGLDGADGMLVITGKRGSARKISEINAPGLVTFMPKGYDTPRKFYSPKYGTIPDNNPDLRTTVFWEPHLVTDENGKAKVNYYNTDRTGKYQIVIEGIDANGYLGRKVLTYEVK